MFYDRKTLKLKAKTAIHATRPGARMVTLVYTLLTGFVPAVILLIAMFLTPLMSTVMQFVTYAATDPWILEDTALGMRLLGSMGVSMLVILFLCVLMGLLEMVLSYGYVGWSLKVWKGEETGYSNIFDGFPQVNRVLGSGVMVGVFTFLWLLIPTIIASVLTYALDNSAFSVLMQLAVSVCSVFISYRYCLTPYFIMSEPNMGVFEAITASKTAMRGNMGKRFVLDLSYLGWVLAEVGIVYIFIFIGMFIAIFQSMYAISYYGYVDPTAGELMSMLLTIYGWIFGMAFVGGVVSLPLSLWVTAYQQTAYAGFFLSVTGQDRAAVSEPPIPPAPEVPPAPTIPPAPVVPESEPQPGPAESESAQIPETAGEEPPAEE